MQLWKNDKELFALARAELFPALVGDILDTHGYLHQFLPPQIKPLGHEMIIIGRAMTVLESDMPVEKMRSRNSFGRSNSFNSVGSVVISLNTTRTL